MDVYSSYLLSSSCIDVAAQNDHCAIRVEKHMQTFREKRKRRSREREGRGSEREGEETQDDVVAVFYFIFATVGSVSAESSDERGKGRGKENDAFKQISNGKMTFLLP